MISFSYCLIGHLDWGGIIEYKGQIMYNSMCIVDNNRICHRASRCNKNTREIMEIEHRKLCTYAIPIDSISEINTMTQEQLEIYSFLEEIVRGRTEVPKCADGDGVKRHDYECLAKEIKKLTDLKHLFVKDSDVKYNCSKYITSEKFNHLQKCVILTSKFKFLEIYIDLYLDVNLDFINYQNEKGWTALMLASQNSKHISTERTVEILLKHGANTNLKNEDGVTALMMAAGNSKTTSCEKTVNMILTKGTIINLQDKNSNSALMHASIDFKTNSTDNTLLMLLEHNADINLQNKDFDTALTLSVKNDDIYKRESIKLLLSKMKNYVIEINDKSSTDYYYQEWMRIQNSMKKTILVKIG